MHRYPTRFQERLFRADQFAAECVPNETVEDHLDAYYQLVADTWHYPDDVLNPYLPLMQFLIHHSYLFHRKPELVTMVKDYLPVLRRHITSVFQQYGVYTDEYYNIYHALQHTTFLHTELNALRSHVEQTYLVPYGKDVQLAIGLSVILDNLESVLPLY